MNTLASSSIRMLRAPVQVAVRQYTVAATNTVANATATTAASHSTQRLAGASAASLYAKGRVLGFKRAKRNQRPDISLVQIEGVKTAADTEFYLGKRVAFVYRAKREVNGSKIRCIWGRITRAHGGSGAVKARFRNNLPAKSFGASVRVMMYPSR
ncbi:60S ribosomal protein L33A [Podila epicladia]|nr:60S ribosomal protein L33A [Podila epicladia]